MSLSIGMIIPNTWKNTKCFKPPTSIGLMDSPVKKKLVKLPLFHPQSSKNASVRSRLYDVVRPLPPPPILDRDHICGQNLVT